MKKMCMLLAVLVLPALVFAGGAKSTGMSTGSGAPPKWGIPVFPEAQSFTEEITNLPNPFISWEGREVSVANWPQRRDEIAQIMQHYMLGYKPDETGLTSEVVDMSVPDTAGRSLVRIKVTRASNGTSGEFLCTLTLPSGTPPEGGWPVILVSATTAATTIQTSLQFNGSDNLYTNRGYAKMIIHLGTVSGGDVSADNGRDVVINGYLNGTPAGMFHILYPNYVRFNGTMNGGGARTENNFYTDATGKVAGTDFWEDDWISDYGDPDAPGHMMRWVWGVSRLIDALEAEKAKPEAARKINLLDPAKIAITGASRNGKSALISGAFEPRIAVVAPAETCAGGLNIDRFVSISVNEADSHRNQQWEPYNISKTSGFGPFDGYGPINKYYQYLKLGDTRYGTLAAKKVTAQEALIDPTKDLDGGVTIPFPSGNTGSTPTAHIIWNDKNQPNSDTNATNLKPGYGVQVHVLGYPSATAMNAWGPQPLTDIRWRYSSYWGGRFFQIPLIFDKMNIHNRVQIMGDFGYFANAPFDMHYLSALVPPRPLFMVAGFNSENSGAEPMFMNFLAAREVYRFLGKEDNIGIAVYVHGHTQTEREVQDLMDVCDSIYAGGGMPARLTPDTVDEYPFPINDPRSRFDYVKLDWAAPGYESIASQVKKLVPANYSY